MSFAEAVEGSTCWFGRLWKARLDGFKGLEGCGRLDLMVLKAWKAVEG